VKAGLASLVICSDAFATLGRMQAKALGYSDLPIAVMPHPFGSRTREEVRATAERCAAMIPRLLGGEGAESRSQPAETLGAHARHIEAPGDQESFDRLCRERGWSDGLPLIAPTPERVQRLLAATRRRPEEAIGRVAPAFGEATVERVAVNAAMTGCEARHLPVLIAAVEAVCDPAFNLQGIQATTNPAATWIIVSGPLAEALEFNAGINCLGPGAWANTTVGRALRLVLQNIGGARPGEMDRATHGQPGKLGFCCAENASANPWEALHVERGCAAGESAVTVVGAAGTLNMNSHTKDAGELLRVFGDAMAYPASNDYWYGGEPWIVLSPEHAQVLQHAGLAKADVKRALWEHSRLAISRQSTKDRIRMQHTRRAELGELAPGARIPIAPRPEGIGILVAGGPGTHSVYVPTFGNTRAVTRVIDA
jgi:hypothetical protein